MITATHDLGAVENIADDCYVLQAGQVVAHALPDAILDDDELLARTRLIHVHRHRHADGRMHSHPHQHRLLR